MGGGNGIKKSKKRATDTCQREYEKESVIQGKRQVVWELEN